MSRQDEHRNHEHDEHKEITIETVSTPPVEVPRAPFGRKIVAAFVDSAIITFVWAALIYRPTTQGTLLDIMLLSSTEDAYLIAIMFAYYFALEGLFAATIGKLLLKLRVLDKDGDTCTFGASFSRNLLRFVDWLPLFYVLGIISIIISSNRQRIRDRIAGTIVCNAPKKDLNPPPAPFLFH